MLGGPVWGDREGSRAACSPGADTLDLEEGTWVRGNNGPSATLCHPKPGSAPSLPPSPWHWAQAYAELRKESRAGHPEAWPVVLAGTSRLCVLVNSS